MRTWLKAGILIVILVVPASLFLFLRSFGRNHYTLRTYYPIVDSTTGQPIIQKKVQYNREVNDTLFHTVPDFQFTDQNNQTVSARNVAGKIFVADFFFTRCLSICPKMSTQLSRVQDYFRDNPQIALLSFSVDPENDSLEVLQKYAAEYKATAGKWYFLTGEKAKIYQLAEKGFFIPASNTGKQTQDLDDLFIHSSKLVLVDKEKHIRGYYDGTDPLEVDRLMLEMQILLSEYEK